MNWVDKKFIDKNVRLLDCPGVVMLKSAGNDASIALRNCKRIEKLDDPTGPGKIPYYTMPPNRNADEPSEAKIVTELGKEFNVDEVYGGESSFIGSLKSVDDFNPVEVTENCRLNFDMMMNEDDASQQAPTQGNGDDESMKSEEENTIPKVKSASSRQNEKLYAEEGMLNAKLKKAEKKRRKKESRLCAMERDDVNVDYDFKVDYIRRESAMDTGNEDAVADESTKNRFELPSGVELDNE